MDTNARYRVTSPRNIVLGEGMTAQETIKRVSRLGKGMQGSKASIDVEEAIKSLAVGETHRYRSRMRFEVGTAEGKPVVIVDITRVD